MNLVVLNLPNSFWNHSCSETKIIKTSEKRNRKKMFEKSGCVIESGCQFLRVSIFRANCADWVGFKGKYFSHYLLAKLSCCSFYIISHVYHIMCWWVAFCYCFLQMTLPSHYLYQLMYREWRRNWLYSFQ